MMQSTTRPGRERSRSLDEMFERLGVPSDLVDAAKVRRVTHEEAVEEVGIRYKSDHLEGVYYPNLDPVLRHIRGGRVRRDHPEIEADGRLIAKYVGPPDRRYLYFAPDAGALLCDASLPVVIVEAEKSALVITAAARRADGSSWPSQPAAVGAGVVLSARQQMLAAPA